jgi:hypothetical protein
MLSHCLNPSCNAQFHYLHEGRVFAVDHILDSPDGSEPQHFVEHYWLCGACSFLFKVVVENGVATAKPIHAETAA